MKNLFNAAFTAQSIFLMLFLIHEFTYYSLGSFFYIVCLLSLIVGCYLLWQAFKNPAITVFLKKMGIVLGILPIIGLIIYAFLLMAMH